MGKPTKTEEATESLDALIDEDLGLKKKKQKQKEKKGVISFMVDRSKLSSALGIIDSLVSFSLASRNHIFIKGTELIIRAAGARKASIKIPLLEDANKEVALQLDLKTLMELIKKFSSAVLLLSLDTKTFQLTLKDKNIVTKLICDSVTIDESDEIEKILTEDIIKLEGKNLNVFSNASIDSKLSSSSGGLQSSHNYTRILVYPKANALCYYTTNGVLINGIETTSTEEEPIELDLENQEMMLILKVMNNIKEFTSIKIRGTEGSSHKFVDISSNDIRVIFNISEITSEMRIEDLIHTQEKKIKESLSFLFLPYKFLDFIKKASPIVKANKIEELVMLVKKEGKVEMCISGTEGNTIKSKHNIEKLKNFPPNVDQIRICFSTLHLAIVLGHYASKPAFFTCIGNLEKDDHYVVFLKHKDEDEGIGYKSLLATMVERGSNQENEGPPF